MYVCECEYSLSTKNAVHCFVYSHSFLSPPSDFASHRMPVLELCARVLRNKWEVHQMSLSKSTRRLFQSWSIKSGKFREIASKSIYRNRKLKNRFAFGLSAIASNSKLCADRGISAEQIDVVRLTIMRCRHRCFYSAVQNKSSHYRLKHSDCRHFDEKEEKKHSKIFSNNLNSSYTLRMFYDNQNDNVNGSDGGGGGRSAYLHQTPFMTVKYM